MKKCPFCRAELLDDSFFCDQCGKELKICLDCHSFVAGKFCTNCSSKNISWAKDYVPLKSVDEEKTSNENIYNTLLDKDTFAAQSMMEQSNQPESEPTQQYDSASEVAVAENGKDICFVGINHAVKLKLEYSKGVYIFGRKEGEFVNFFNSVRFVSRQHAKISFDVQRDAWNIEDLGSSNGTSVNSKRLVPNVPVPIKRGDEVQIAFEKFIIK
jgi:hypothetical protein